METLIIGLLILASLASVTFIIERGLALRRQFVAPFPLLQAVDTFQGRPGLAQLQQLATRQPSSTLGRLLAVASNHLDRPMAETADHLQTRARQEIAKLERGLVILEIITGIAPLLGLVGTVLGLIVLFQGVRAGGFSGDNADLSRGIGTALQATLLGLLVAIPSLAAWSFYSRRVESYAIELEGACDEFLRRAYREAPALPAAIGRVTK